MELNEVKDVTTEVAETAVQAACENKGVSNMLKVGGAIGLGAAAITGLVIVVKKKVVPWIQKRRDTQDKERAAKAKSANPKDYIGDDVDVPEDLPKI